MSQAKVLMNGFKIEEIDVVLREIYGKIFEMRNRGNAKIQRINKKLRIESVIFYIIIFHPYR